MGKWQTPFFALTVAIAATAACSSAEPTPSATVAPAVTSAPTATATPSPVNAGALPTITEESFMTLLTAEDIRGVQTAEVPLTTRFFDYKAMAEGVDPAQVESIESWYGLSFEAAGGTKGMTFSVIDFNSTASASDHFEKMKSEMKSEGPPEMQDMVPPIGDASIEVEANSQGIGSMLIFVKGDKVVSLHTAQPDDQEPLLSLEGLKELAQLVAGKL